MILTLFSLSHATPVPSCSENRELVQSVPDAGSVGVATRIAPALLIEGCSSELGAVSLLDGADELIWEGSFELPFSDATGEGTRLLFELPRLDLVPNTSYVLNISGVGQVPFETGPSSPPAPPIAGPVIQSLDASGWETEMGWQTRVAGFIDHPQPRFVRLRHENDLVPGVVGWTSDPVSFSADLLMAEQQGCFVPEARDEEGTWTAGEPVCATARMVDRPIDRVGVGGWLGCSSAPASPWGLLAIPLLGVRRRR